MEAKNAAIEMPPVTITVCKGDLPEGIVFVDNKMAVDTESLGLNTKRDRLCVCQVGDGNGNVWLVQFDGKDFSAPNLKKYLQDDSLIKLFHFARADISMLEYYLGIKIDTVFCTKIASKLCRTYTDRHGLGFLCNELLGVKLDKQSQTSHWAAPELSEAQKIYAANDVLYLHALSTILVERLKDVNRLEMAQACFDFLPFRSRIDLAGWEETDIFAHH